MMTELEKLRMLLPHWIEHNEEHAGDYARGANVATEAGHPEVAAMIRVAIEKASEANAELQRALDALGGPVAAHGHRHSHAH